MKAQYIRRALRSMPKYHVATADTTASVSQWNILYWDLFISRKMALPLSRGIVIRNTAHRNYETVAMVLGCIVGHDS
jgi:hypothetical protein